MAKSSLSVRLVELLRKHPDGARNADLQKEFGEQFASLLPIMQEMLNEGRLEALQKGNMPMYRLTTEKDLANYNKLRGLEDYEVMVFQAIKAAGNRGVWTRDLKYRTGLQQNRTKFAKILKNLERKRLIKSCRTIAAKNKKIYMLFDLEPARELRGGAWYTDNEFDQGMIRAVCEYLKKFVRKSLPPPVIGMLKAKDLLELYESGTMTAEDAVVAVTAIDMLKTDVELGAEDLEQILDLLTYDGTLYKTDANAPADGNFGYEDDSGREHKWIYRPMPTRTNFNMCTDTPCGVCPVFDQCAPGGTVSPAKCPYLRDWLALP
jgi:DNA-directed RNA polymerase III subunit RPC6